MVKTVPNRPAQNMGPTQILLAQEMYRVRKMKPSAIAKAFGRNKSTITRRLFKTKVVRKVGRKKILSKKDVDRLIEAVESSLGLLRST